MSDISSDLCVLMSDSYQVTCTVEGHTKHA